MNDYDYIKIAVHGQFDGAVKTVYTYPSGGADAWDKDLFDPSAIIKNFLNARDCYVMSAGEGGHRFSLITRNPLDPSSGYILLTMQVADGYALTGRQTVNTLGALKKTLLEDGDRFDDAVTRCLEAVGISAKGVKLKSWENAPATARKAAGLCYRTYVSGQDLETILSFPDQNDYARFEGVVVISATASLRPGVNMERITTPVKKTYTVVCPEGVTASKDVVSDGERLTLTFVKEGFTPRKETVVTGAPSPYLRYEGAAIRVKSPRESGMGFVRRVKLVVKSAKGGTVSGYTINVNGRPVNTMEPFIELNELELTPGNKTEISVASTNYRPLKVVKDAKELSTTDTIELTLQPMEQGIILRLDFGEGRVFEQEISIEKNTPEYSQLHSGNFHGFRASRMTTAGAGEVYNIDVRSSSKPVAPSFVNVSANAGTRSQRITAPVFENVTKSGGSTGSVDRQKPAKPERPDSDRPADGTPRKGIFDWLGAKSGYVIGTVLAIAILVIAFIFILPTSDKESSEALVDSVAQPTAFTADPEALKEQNAQAPAQPAAPQEANQPAAASTPEAEKADIAYLNDNKAWDSASLKSPKFQALLTAIGNGDIDAIVNNEYFAVKGNSTNRYANDVATWIWQAKGTHQEGKNVEVLKNSLKNGRVNVYELWESISRYKPSQPNTAPRPGAN